MDNDDTGNVPKSKTIFDKPCDICGNSAFEWGTLITRGVKTPEHTLYFRLEGSTFEDGDFGIEARRCKTCGNIKMFGSI